MTGSDTAAEDQPILYVADGSNLQTKTLYNLLSNNSALLKLQKYSYAWSVLQNTIYKLKHRIFLYCMKTYVALKRCSETNITLGFT